MKKVFNKILTKLFLLIFKKQNVNKNNRNEFQIITRPIKYSIGITTFDKRFEKYFKPLIQSIYTNNKDVEVVIMVNAPYQQKMNEEYKKDMLLFLSNFPNTYPHFCTEFRSLSKLWNNELLFSSNDFVLILNDDVTVLPDFFKDLESLIIKNQYKSFKINGSWSHVLLNKTEINAVGWFDERLLGIGEEDGDMEFRWCKHYNEEFKSLNTSYITNHVDDTSDTSIKKHSNSKYSKFNRDFILNKYKIDFINGQILGMNEFPVKQNIKDDIQYSYEEYYWVNKNKL